MAVPERLLELEPEPAHRLTAGTGALYWAITYLTTQVIQSLQTEANMDINFIANVLQQANIRVTAVGNNLIELECAQREAELARDSACQMIAPVVELHETLHLPTDYPRTWEITFPSEGTDCIDRPQSDRNKSDTNAANHRPANAQNSQSAGNRGHQYRKAIISNSEQT